MSASSCIPGFTARTSGSRCPGGSPDTIPLETDATAAGRGTPSNSWPSRADAITATQGGERARALRHASMGLALTLAWAAACGQSFDQITSMSSGNVTTWRIDRPNVTSPMTAYPQIAFRPGDVVRLSAGGCVQTGGSGKTWKRYVDPQGSSADELYSALVSIPGATPGVQRLQPWLGRPIPITRPASLSLGYKDNNYRDNGYYRPDDGTGNQCRGMGNAQVIVMVTHNAAPTQSSAYPRYNEIYQKSSHNAYEDKPPLVEQLGRYRFRSVELDLHHSKTGRTAPAEDFLVYHADIVATQTSCDPFSACLAQLKAWHDGHPAHEIVTVFLDVKDAWRPSHSQASLDALLRRVLGSLVFAPGELVARCPGSSGLRAAIRSCGWPATDALRGRFMFVLTGEDTTLDAYTGAPQLAHTHAAFVAPEIEEGKAIEQHANAVFFNLNSDHFTTGRSVFSAGYVSRVFYRNTPVNVHGINDVGNWNAAVNSQIHHIATDQVNPVLAPFTATQNAHGWPFRCMLRTCSELAER